MQQLAYPLMRLKLADGEQADARAGAAAQSRCGSEEVVGNRIGYEEGTAGGVRAGKAQLYL
jgi:hypothetical protein